MNNKVLSVEDLAGVHRFVWASRRSVKLWVEVDPAQGLISYEVIYKKDEASEEFQSWSLEEALEKFNSY